MACALGRQRRILEPRAHAPERVHAVEHGAGEEGRDRLDLRAGRREALGRGLHGGANLRVGRKARAGVEQQAELQAAHLAVELRPLDRLRRQAHGVALVGLRQHLHQQGRVGHRARHRPGRAAGVRRIDRDAAQARFQADDAAPAGRQAHRAADVGADVQRAVAGGNGGAGARAAAARAFRQVPRVAGQRMEARQARRQHPVVGHRRLAEDHRAGFAHARGGRRIVRGGREHGGAGAERRRRAARRDVLLDHRRHAVDRAERLRPSPSALAKRAPRPARRRRRAHRWREDAAPTPRCAPAPPASPRPAKARARDRARPARWRPARAARSRVHCQVSARRDRWRRSASCSTCPSGACCRPRTAAAGTDRR